MDLWEAVVVALRRWYVLLPVLVIGVVVALQLAGSVDPVHEASATIQYRPPDLGDDPEAAAKFAANPYSDLRSLAIATELSADDEALRSELPADFTVETDRREPVLYIVASSTDEAAALDTLDELVTFAVETAADLQNTAELLVEPDVLRQDETTSVDLTSRTRARVLLLVVAVVAAMATAVLVETVLANLKRRQGGGSAEKTEPNVVWFGVPLQGGQPPIAPPQQPYLAPAPDASDRFGGTLDDEDDGPSASRGSRWSR